MKGKTEIIVQGKLDKKWTEWFEGMNISYEADKTILLGYIKDESKMHGILNAIRDLNIKLVSVNPAKEKEANNKINILKHKIMKFSKSITQVKKLSLTILFVAIISTLSIGQNLTQTVRGTLIDTDSKIPLIGATILLVGSDPIIGTATDIDGNFRLEKIPVGRIALQISYLGYESKTFPNIVVNSGKEVVLHLNMSESVVNLNEIVVKPKRKNGEAQNEMSLLSSRSVSIEQTKRFAGTFNDPSRILSNFAGVTSTQDGSNDIIVRGNSPKYIQWRLEGVEITNPNHFADQNYSLGGFNALNNSVLSTSDFYTGAFSPEFGNALSGVYDIKLRAGNNEKFESTFGFGILGTDFTIEGPFKKGYGGSYLINYRYSTVALISDLGLLEGVPDALDFQDFTSKIVLPTKNAGTFSLFALGGLNGFDYKDIKDDMLPTPGDRSMNPNIVEDFNKNNHLFNTGLSHSYPINNNSYFKTTLAFSSDGINNDIYESEIIAQNDDQGGILIDTVNRILNFKSRLKKSSYKASVLYSNKLNAKNKIQVGSKYTLYNYNNSQSVLNEDLTSRKTLINSNENVGVVRNFFSWKHRLNENITVVSGLHNMNVLYNGKNTIEPRFAVNWKLNNTASFHAGYGNHSNMEQIHNYFIQTQLADGTIAEPNKDLDLLKAHHYVLGFKKQITENITTKMEVYYQDLYNLPVENDATSFYSTINGGDEFRYIDLVNEGTGKNYGVEFTLERYFTKNYYYLINASVYVSKYKSLEGIERNTQHNGNYLVNILAGKEFEKLGKKHNKSVGINSKLFFGGGRKIIPLLRDSQGQLAVDPANNQYWDYSKAYENSIENSYQVTLSVNYKIDKPRATHELKLELQNLTGHKSKITEYYDETQPNSIGYLAFPVGLFPNLMYRVYF
jgi:CarboxypepD_reg-like domain/TonB dependent receptor-like, beta-barrel